MSLKMELAPYTYPEEERVGGLVMAQRKALEELKFDMNSAVEFNFLLHTSVHPDNWRKDRNITRRMYAYIWRTRTAQLAKCFTAVWKTGVRFLEKIEYFFTTSTPALRPSHNPVHLYSRLFGSGKAAGTRNWLFASIWCLQATLLGVVLRRSILSLLMYGLAWGNKSWNGLNILSIALRRRIESEKGA